MSEESNQTQEAKRDLLDGGFAVVDRERIIEEETKVKTPWYKHLSNCLFAPSKAIEENVLNDPPKGMGLGICVVILLTELVTFITFMNPAMRQTTYDALRVAGKAENQLAQIYSISMVSGLITAGIVGLAVTFIDAILFKIAFAIAKVKISVKKLFIIMLLMSIAGLAVSLIETSIRYFCGLDATAGVFSLSAFMDLSPYASNIFLTQLLSMVSLTSIIGIIYSIIGLSVGAQISKIKSTIVYIIITLIQVGFVSWIGSMASQMAMGM